MPVPVRLAAYIRVLRLMGALALLVGLVAVAAIVKGGPADRSLSLIALAIVLGMTALLGMALIALPLIPRKKETNDPRP